jgi:hypothetical protein
MSDDAGQHKQQRALRRRNIALAVVLAGLAVGFYLAFFVVVSSN